MSGRIPEEDCSWLWPCCQECQSRKECPYVLDQLVCHTARQGRAAACCLTAAADRFLTRISNANDIRRLLEGSRDLEQALSHALHAEMAMIDDLRDRMAKCCL